MRIVINDSDCPYIAPQIKIAATLYQTNRNSTVKDSNSKTDLEKTTDKKELEPVALLSGIEGLTDIESRILVKVSQQGRHPDSPFLLAELLENNETSCADVRSGIRLADLANVEKMDKDHLKSSLFMLEVLLFRVAAIDAHKKTIKDFFDSDDAGPLCEYLELKLKEWVTQGNPCDDRELVTKVMFHISFSNLLRYLCQTEVPAPAVTNVATKLNRSYQIKTFAKHNKEIVSALTQLCVAEQPVPRTHVPCEQFPAITLDVLERDTHTILEGYGKNDETQIGSRTENGSSFEKFIAEYEVYRTNALVNLGKETVTLRELYQGALGS
ncbi:hypothetical protein BGX20_003650 [Mortierella sp. AD010]|nr:hypothetical protein BGX20_003650 [Mortierella sp. AD010]